MEIRAAELADIDAIEKLRLQCFTADFRALYGNHSPDTLLRVLLGLRWAKRRPFDGVWVAVDGATLVGVLAWYSAEMDLGRRRDWLRCLAPMGLWGALRFLVAALLIYPKYRPAPNEVYFGDLAVHPDYRRRRVAVRLMQHAAKEARRSGKELACGFVARDNLESRNMLQLLGWREVGTHKTFGRRLLGQPALIRVEQDLGREAGAQAAR